MQTIRKIITHKIWSVVIVLGMLFGSAAIIATSSNSASETAPGAVLPDGSESEKVDKIVEKFDDDQKTAAIIVFEKETGKFSKEDTAYLMALSFDVAAELDEKFIPPAQIAENNKIASLVIPLDETLDVKKQEERKTEIDSVINNKLPDNIKIYFAGPEGIAIDVSKIFEGADFRLLLITVIVVTVLLLITYRSPILWIVPLVVVGLADALARVVAVSVAELVGMQLDASITGILSVLVFGAGTNYALLLISRYRDELRLHKDRREAMQNALKHVVPAVLASGGTVILSLLTLLFAGTQSTRALGFACAVGVAIAMVFALVMLPAALVVFGRWLFWPLIPKEGSRVSSEGGLWYKLGVGVAKKPIIVLVLGFAILAGCASGTLNIKVGLSQSETFLNKPESIIGQEKLGEAFGSASASPATIVAKEKLADKAQNIAENVDGVVKVTVDKTKDGYTRIYAQLESDSGSDESLETIKDLRKELKDTAIVGGLDAQQLDINNTKQADQKLIIPLILIIVLLVLIVLLRALLAPILLLITVVASFFASLGIGVWLFDGPFGFPGITNETILYSFLFLVALGVDYNIFLVTRAKEEAQDHGTVGGMIRALAATGGVITSAGILLAAVFAVLGVLPLVVLTQIGIIVCIGVLLDTLLVRTVIVPALAFTVKDKFWWPRKNIAP